MECIIARDVFLATALADSWAKLQVLLLWIQQIVWWGERADFFCVIGFTLIVEGWGAELTILRDVALVNTLLLPRCLPFSLPLTHSLLVFLANLHINSKFINVFWLFLWSLICQIEGVLRRTPLHLARLKQLNCWALFNYEWLNEWRETELLVAVGYGILGVKGLALVTPHGILRFFRIIIDWIEL